MRIIRVGVDTPRMTDVDRDGLSGKRRGIRKAMLWAVEITEPGTLIIQEDVEIMQADLEIAEAHIEPGTITCLNPPRTGDPGHTCPQAFIIGDEPTRHILILAWRRPDIQTCYSWQEIPKNYPHVRGTHDGRAWKGRAVVHCWESIGADQTCMRLDGHRGDHEPTPDDEIGIRFSP